MDGASEAPVWQLPRAAFERDLPLVEGALTLIASGGAPRVTLVGLAVDLRLSEAVRELAARRGVRVLVVDRNADGDPQRRMDIVLEPI